MAALLLLPACGGAPIRPSVVPDPRPDRAPTIEAAGALATRWATARVAGLEERVFSPETYWALLLPILERDPERFRVRTIGASVEGRPLRRIDFGRGEETVLLWSQMHGNESTASRALLDVIAYLDEHPEDPLVRRIEGRLAITILPVLNPDGAARFRRHNAVGIDVNRDARALATPEGRALKTVRDEIEARWGFNLHDQSVRTRLGTTQRDVLVALLAPPPGHGTSSPANVRARRLCSLLADAVAPVVGDQIARYDESFNPRAFGDLMTSWGTAVVLIESGGELADPHKERLRRANFVGLLAALEAIASERWRAWDDQRYLSLPRNGPWVHDLLIRGAAIVLPGSEPVRADLAIAFEDSLQRTGGRIEEIGDLGDAHALQEIDADGLYFLPDAGVIGSEPGPYLRPGDPATGVLARDPQGGDVVLRLLAGISTR